MGMHKMQPISHKVELLWFTKIPPSPLLLKAAAVVDIVVVEYSSSGAYIKAQCAMRSSITIEIKSGLSEVLS